MTCAVFEIAKSDVAVVAKQSANPSGIVTVVDVERAMATRRPSSTNRAGVALCGEHFCVSLKAEAVVATQLGFSGVTWVTCCVIRKSPLVRQLFAFGVVRLSVATPTQATGVNHLVWMTCRRRGGLALWVQPVVVSVVAGLTEPFSEPRLVLASVCVCQVRYGSTIADQLMPWPLSDSTVATITA